VTGLKEPSKEENVVQKLLENPHNFRPWRTALMLTSYKQEYYILYSVQSWNSWKYNFH